MSNHEKGTVNTCSIQRTIAGYLSLLCLFGSAFAWPRSGLCQDRDTLTVRSESIADFGQATRIARTTDGTMYVVDAREDRIVMLDRDGKVLEWFGGKGTDEGQFDTIRDVDPTNGLIINVADAGNGRIQRFAKGFRFLETIVLSNNASREGRESSFRSGSARVDGPGQGYPIGVASSAAEDLYVLDAMSGRVIRWDRERRRRWIIGGEDAQDGELVSPVSIAVRGNRLYVADAFLGGVMVYDLFGTFVRTIGSGMYPDIVSVRVDDRRLMIVLPDRIQFYTIAGRRTDVVRVDLNTPVVDAVAAADELFILTATSLLRLEKRVSE